MTSTSRRTLRALRWLLVCALLALPLRASSEALPLDTIVLVAGDAAPAPAPGVPRLRRQGAHHRLAAQRCGDDSDEAFATTQACVVVPLYLRHRALLL
jgi:hypothetical protein